LPGPLTPDDARARALGAGDLGAGAAAFVALAVAAIVWSRALDNGFVHVDDPHYLTQNAMVQAGLTWDGVVSAFTTTHVWNWHPLTMISHMIDVELFGLAPAGHHLVSVLLHLIASALLFGAVREATRDPWLALFVAVLFALHPLRVQSVAWASERKDVLSGAFWMGALWCHARWARQAGGATQGRRARVASIVLGLAAMLSKPMAVTLPLTLVLMDAWPLARIGGWRDLRARVVEQAPLLAGALFVAAMTVVAQDEAIAHAASRDPALRVAAALVALPRYVAMIAWPYPLSISHGLYQEQPPAALAVAASLAIIGFTAALARAAVSAVRTNRTNRTEALSQAAIMGWLWFIVTLLPVLGLVGAQAVADRYTYIPSIGVLLAGGAAWRALTTRFSVGVATVACALAVIATCACAWRTWVEIAAWHDPLTLTAHAVAADPHDHDARVEHAIRLGETGDFAGAIGHIEEAVRIAANGHTWDLLGQAYLRAGRAHDAVAALETATTVDASLAKVHVHLAEAYLVLAMRDEAARAIGAALALEPASPRALTVRDRIDAPPTTK
jgi:tetratricopeptide (TPR) repeat protein